ncbi:MAG: phosphoglycerate mutase, partial [Chloroflexota bacterium]|nr:phosphoglycerate mutase [Chloroflexota bacterium]
PHPESGLSELETAHTPHLDALAVESALGLSMPVGYGITPGSGPGHLALFGYDPLQFDIGRGVLEATGIGFPLEPSDVAARGNFCTLAADGTIADRRAGRLPSEQSAAIVERLRGIRIDGLEVFVEPVREHRFVLVLRGAGLSAAISETDPQAEGVAPLPCRALSPEGEATAAAVNEFVARAAALIGDEPAANGLVLRGVASIPSLPQMRDVWGLRPASCAIYPMYRGLARLAGMTALPAGDDIGDQTAALGEHW